ncbi:RcnB family protein [Sphingomonas sp.]|uniref:RcnB family protein n=1 Tax=Sphingomonas sp. TaxID=28214 RepID=UPI002B5C0560|nr:RcnB family protein [Sphingomonas sp.]HWK36112.1 RcnB family protein [Sphingomonas sp.]
MRAYWIAATAAIATLAVAAPATAQQPAAPAGGQRAAPPRAMPAQPRNWQQHGNWNRGNRPVVNQRWGGQVNGRWYAGNYAPGGWAAYRAPTRGWVLPRYWFAPTFYISDFGNYGLGAPPVGYSWTRYYDDAVLIDGGGRVYDSVSGIDWDRGYGDQGYGDGGYGERVHAEDGYDRDDRVVSGAPYPPPPPPRERRDDGVGGAVIGGVLGGVAGNVIAGRGDKLAGTLIGAGAGAIAGTAIDRAEDRRDRRRGPPPPPPPPYGAPYPAPGHPGDGYAYAPPPVVYAPPAEVVQATGGHDPHRYAGAPRTTVVHGPYGSVTTVTVIPAVTTTTVTKEYYYAAAPVRTYRKVVRRPAKAPACNCKYVRR